MIGKQFCTFPSQPPNWIATDPFAAFFAVMLLSVYASSEAVNLSHKQL
jgi:hypothetical protein